MQQQGSSLGNSYIFGLDGLRAFSVLAVVAGHASIPKAPASLGVTVFFFISGFLITGLLLREASANHGQFNIKNFYIRRYLRLAPELTLYVAVSVIGSVLIYGPRRSIDVLGSLFYFMNYVDIFSPSDPPGPFRLGHLWSLSVEEHFYLTWPLLLSACVGSRRRVILLCAVLIVVPIAIRSVALQIGLPIAYLRLASECRIDSIAFGCLFAAAMHYYPSLMRTLTWSGHWIGAVGLALVILFTFGGLINLRGSAHEILVYTGQGVGLTFLFAYLYASGSGSWLLTLLEYSPLRFIGQVSYGFYLWHFMSLYLVAMAFGYASPHELPIVLKVLCAVLGGLLGVVLGWISLKIALRPVRHLRQRFGAHLLTGRK